jgi:hypothetical protein
MGFSINNPINALLPFPANTPKSPQEATTRQFSDQPNVYRRAGQDVRILVGPDGKVVSECFNA